MSDDDPSDSGRPEGAQSSEAAVDPRERVESMYRTARRSEDAWNDEDARHALALARDVAEVVTAALGPRLPDHVRRPFEGKDLDVRIKILEQNAAHVGIPRYVVAALKAVQAYGNCAKHPQDGEPRPPRHATVSAMESLAHVKEWFVRDQVGAARRPRQLVLREPPPTRPGFRERRVLGAAIPRNLPRLSDEQWRTVINPSAPPVVRLAALLQFHGLELEVVAAICRAVLSRESTRADLSVTAPDHLALMLDELCEERPATVPRTIAHQVREVVRRMTSVQRAIELHETDLEPLVAEAERTAATADVVRWFDHSYVRRGSLERNWGWLVLALLGYAVLSGVATQCAADGARQQRRQLLRDHCAASGTADQPICDDLRAREAAERAADEARRPR